MVEKEKQAEETRPTKPLTIGDLIPFDITLELTDGRKFKCGKFSLWVKGQLIKKHGLEEFSKKMTAVSKFNTPAWEDSFVAEMLYLLLEDNPDALRAFPDLKTFEKSLVTTKDLGNAYLAVYQSVIYAEYGGLTKKELEQITAEKKTS